jgi:SAM-dependent methyltransferase
VMTAKFDEQASEYDAKAIIQRDLASWTAEWLEPRAFGLQGVEFGAGTGCFTRFVIQTGIDLRAVDLSPQMIDIGAEMEPKASWELGDAWKPSSKLNADRLFSCALLQWCPDPIAVLSRWHDCLSRNGRLLSGLFVSDTLPEFSQVLPGIEPFVWRSKAEWKNLFEKAGFKIFRSESSQRKYQFENARAVLRHLHHIGAVISGRFSVSALRTALLNYDTAFGTHNGVPSTWTFFRIECLGGKTD